MVKLDAHRGFMTDFPENTIFGFETALKCDIDMLEIDLHMTSDGEIILMHDHTVDRTTNGTGFIKDKTLKEIKQLDAGVKCSRKFKGIKVPTFIEFLEMLKSYPSIEVCVELKDYPQDRSDAFISADKSIQLIEKYGITDKIYLNSWSGEIIEYLHNKYGKKYRLHGYYPVFLNSGNFDKNKYYSYLYCACMFNRYINENGEIRSFGNGEQVMEKEDFDFLISKGVEPWVYFNPTTYPRLKKAIEYGAKGVTANDPITAGILLDVLGARKLKK